MEMEKGGKVTNKFSKKSLHNVTFLSSKPFGTQILQTVLTGLDLIFADILNPLPNTPKAI